VANQFRLFRHAGAYWLMGGLRAAMPKRSSFAVAQFDTLRLRFIKIAARVVERKTQIRVSMPTACPTRPSYASSSSVSRASSPD
jgi:Transposase DDE domain group 1